MSSIKSQIINFLVNGAKEPIGLSCANPTFSFGFETQKSHIYMQSYRILVTEKLSGALMWDSGEVPTKTSLDILYGGSPLLDNTDYKVLLSATIGDEVLQKNTHFRTGYIDKPIPVSPKISASKKIVSPLLRHTFFTGSVVDSATLYVSCNGLFKAFINDIAVTPRFLIGTKGVALAFDVSALLTSNNNTLGLWLMRDPADYKSQTPYVQCALHFTSVENEKFSVDLSSDWFYKQSPVSVSEGGEVYDNRISIHKWCDSYISTADWTPCVISEGDNVFGAQVRTPQALSIRKSYRTKTVEDDLTIYDFGAITAGRIKVKIMGEPGAKLIIKYAKTEDALNYTTQEDIYIIKGHEIEVYEPLFSTHMFRYAKLYIDGVAQLILAEAVTLGTNTNTPTYFNCNCISQYKNYVTALKKKADYTAIPKEYRTLEGIILSNSKQLLECQLLGLEQLRIKSLSNEILAPAYFKLAGVNINPQKLTVSANTTLPPDAQSLSYEYHGIFGKVCVYLRKIAGTINSDYVIPPSFTADITLPNGKNIKLENGKYMSEELPK